MAQAKDPMIKEPEGKGMPGGEGPIEFRKKKDVHLAEAGRVVREDWVGRVCGRSVRVYRGAPEGSLPAAVKAALAESGIEIGIITHEELGIRPKRGTIGIVNLTQQG